MYNVPVHCHLSMLAPTGKFLFCNTGVNVHTGYTLVGVPALHCGTGRSTFIVHATTSTRLGSSLPDGTSTFSLLTTRL